MDLRKFISETLIQIIGGISDAQANMIEFQRGENSDYTAPYVNPNPVSENKKELRDIEFDVAVTVSEGNSAEGRPGLSVMGISIGGKGASEQTNSLVSRIKFSIPVSYPYVCKKKHL